MPSTGYKVYNDLSSGFCSIEYLRTHSPSCTTVRTLGDKEDLTRLLSNLFADKVAKIRSAIDQRLGGKQPDPISVDKPFFGKSLSGLRPVSHAKVKQTFDAVTGKASPRDFISTTLLVFCSGVFASVIARLANLSFAEGPFPIQFKAAQVAPIVKKADLYTSNPELTDYCNALLAGKSESNPDKLHRVQNTLASVVIGLRRRDHVTLSLKELHWLPIRTRITFKVAIVVYRLRERRQLTYLADLIANYVRARTMRSSNKTLLAESSFIINISGVDHSDM